MKKVVKVIIAVILLICFIRTTYIAFFQYKQLHDIKEFSIHDYQYRIEKYSNNKNVGQIENISTLVKKATDLWNEELNAGIGNMYIDSIFKMKLFGVIYDSEEECWLIFTGKKNTFGEGLNAMIRKNGDVLAVWGSKYI